MEKAEVFAFLEREQDAEEIARWKAKPEDSGGLKSFGVGLTRLRKYAKQVGRDPKLAKQLWRTKIYEAKVISLLIDDPKSITIEQAETQVEQLRGGFLQHVFSSCDATLAKSPSVLELIEKWTASKDTARQGCGYGLLYEVSKWKKKSAPDEAYFLAHVEHIEKTHSKRPVAVRLSMGGALMGIGKRSKKLNAAALAVAKKIGPIEFDPDGKCPPFDVAMHLSSDYVKQRLGI